jgi:hypothetical protein
MNKRAVSSVVAAVLLILLTVSAMTVLAGILVPFVKDRLYGSTDCLDYENYFSFVEKIDEVSYNCYEDSSFNHSLMIKTKPDINDSNEKLKGFQISFFSDNSEIFEINRTSKASNQLWEYNETASGNLYYPRPGETVTYVFDLNKKYNKAEIRAVLSNGRICTASDSIEIIKCDTGINLSPRT